MVFDGDGLSTEATEFNPSPVVNDLRKELDNWRRLPNPSQWKVSPITQRLLQHWRAIQADQAQSIWPFYCQLDPGLPVTPGITIKDRLRVLLPNDAGSYYASRNLVPHDLLPDLNKAKIVITNYHAFKLRETFDAATGTRRALEGHGDALQTAETEGQMIQRVMGDLMGMKGWS